MGWWGHSHSQPHQFPSQKKKTRQSRIFCGVWWPGLAGKSCMLELCWLESRHAYTCVTYNILIYTLCGALYGSH
jgi:hypothetical protein